MNRQRAAQASKIYKVQAPKAPQIRSYQLKRLREVEQPDSTPPPKNKSPVKGNSELAQLAVANLQADAAAAARQRSVVIVINDDPDKMKKLQLTTFGLFASFFLLDYAKWPDYVRCYIAANQKRSAFFTVPIVMPFIALFEFLLFAINTVDIENGRLDIDWIVNADWARLDLTKSYEIWRWFTFMFTGSALQLLLNCVVHATFGVALEIFNGTLSLVAVHIGYLFMAWLACLYRVTEKTAQKLPLDGLVNDLDCHIWYLQIFAWIGLYSMLLANCIFHRRWMSYKFCLPVLSLGSWFLIHGFVTFLAEPTFGLTSQIIWAALIGSTLTALFAIPAKIPQSNSIEKFVSNCSILIYLVIAMGIASSLRVDPDNIPDDDLPGQLLSKRWSFV